MDGIGPIQPQKEEPIENPTEASSSSMTGLNMSALSRNPALHPTREDSPYPDEAMLNAAAAASPYQSLAETAANAQLQLQQQINLMAQAIAMHPGTNVAAIAPTNNLPVVTAAALLAATASGAANPHPVDAIANGSMLSTADPASGLSTMLDQYVAAAAASIQQQEAVAAAVYNSQPVASTALLNNFGAPSLTAFLQPSAQPPQGVQAVQPPSSLSSAQFQLLQQQQNAVFCPCAAQMTATACPFHQQQQQMDPNNNGTTTAARAMEQHLQRRESLNLNSAVEHFVRQRGDFQILLPNNPTFPQQHQSASTMQAAPNPNPVGPVVGIVQPLSSTNRMARTPGSSSLKRTNAAAFAENQQNSSAPQQPDQNGPISAQQGDSTTMDNMNMRLLAAFNTHISSPPPMMFSPNSTSIRLATGGGQRNNEQGPSRAPKLRRIVSYEDVSSDDADEIVPSISMPTVTAADISAASTATAAALVQLQQQAAAAAALPSAASAMLSLAAAATPAAQLLQTNSSQQQQETSAEATVDVVRQRHHNGASPASAAAAAAAASTISSVAAGVEQIVAAALTAASAASALSPQALAAITGAAGFPATAAAAQCAVCAAAACQSRLQNPVAAAAVTACSCLHHHHHHHHLHHCHHHQAALAPQPFPLPTPPICTLCNSTAVINGTTTPSPGTMSGNGTTTTSSSNSGSVVNGNGSTNMQQQQQLAANATLCTSSNSSSTNNNNNTNQQHSTSSNPATSLHPNTSSTSQPPPHQQQQHHFQQFQQLFSQSDPYVRRGPPVLFADPSLSAPTFQPQQQAQLNIGINATINANNNGGNLSGTAPPCASAAAAAVTAQSLMNAHQQAAAAAAALSPSAVTAMLLNSAAAMGQQQSMSNVPAQQQQQIPSLYSLQRNATLAETGLTAALAAAQAQAQQSMNTMQQSLLASRLAQQERERETANQFYQQRAQQAAQAAAANLAAQQQHHHHLMRPLIMMPQRLPVMDLSSLVLLHHHPGAEAALVLNGGGAASALAHAANPHHIVANAMATATAPEPQPVGATLEQIKRHSQKLSYVEDPEIPEQERERCTVCLCEFETGDELRGLNCGHLFHMECIDPWLQQNKKCPLCRIDMDKGVGAAMAGSSTATAAAAAAAEVAEVVLNAYAQASATSSTTTC